jgi:hypothetical protein
LASRGYTMPTKLLAKSAPALYAGTIKPRKKAGRPAREWLKAFVMVPHPVNARLDKTVPQAAVMLWTGRSRQTVAHWAEAGAIPDLACRRLCQLYAHGLAPLPPGADDKSARLWQQFRFAQLDTPHGRQWHLITPGGESFNAAQVWAARQCASGFLRMVAKVSRYRDEATAARTEVQRLTDNFGAG